MGKPRRNFLATAADTVNPPNSIEDNHVIAQIQKAEGNNLYTVKTSNGEGLLVELPARFRSQIWVKRGSFVVIDTSAFQGRSNKLGGEIANIIRDEKQWRKQGYWSVFSSAAQYIWFTSLKAS